MNYRIVCTEQEPVYLPTRHAHIVAVGTGVNPDQATLRWTLQEVIEAIENGWHTFYTQGERSGLIARVVVVYCAICRRKIIKSTPDAVYDNNLDSLRRCHLTR
jgi:hypothetical protein